MFESALTLRDVQRGQKIAYKTLVSAGLVALAVILPQIVHMALGQPGGVQWLPMYLPVLVGGCLLGWKWALWVGLASPLVSFILTFAMGNPMPQSPRLPFMMAELAVFALVSGLFSKQIARNGWWAFPAVIAAQLTGRAFFLALVKLFEAYVPFSAVMIWSQIKQGLMGLAVQAVVVPLIILALRAVLMKEKQHD